MHASSSLGRRACAPAGAAGSSQVGAPSRSSRTPTPRLFAPAPAMQRVLAPAHQRALLVAAAAAMRLGSRAQSKAAAATPHGHRPAASLAASASASAATQQQSPSASLTEQQRAQLAAFLEHLLKANETMNLTAVRDPAEAWTRHVEDSLALLPVLERWAAPAPPGNAGSGKKKHQQQQRQMQQQKKKPEAWFEEDEEEQDQQAETAVAAETTKALPPAPLRLIDVGTGPGLPGMILAIARPHWRVTLLDSLRKRCDFLKGAATMLGLQNVDVVWSRAEDAGRLPQLRDVHDAAVARAVAEARVLAELCLPFVRPGGVFVAAKGAAIEGEVEAAAKAIAALRGRLAAVEEVESFYGSGAGPGAPASAAAASGGEEEAGAAAANAAEAAASLRRTAIVIEKVGATPAAYPRPPGTPNKKPL